MRSKHNNQINTTHDTRTTRDATRYTRVSTRFSTWSALTPCGGGFTLIEIMLALGVLGIGMVLVATLFPPAIMQARRADRNTMAMILAQNSKATLEIRSSMVPDHEIFIPNSSRPNEFSKVPIGTRNLGGTDRDDDDLIHTYDAEYGPRSDVAGWQALVRQLKGSEIYQFVVIPYLLSPVMEKNHVEDRLTNVRDGQQYTWNGGSSNIPLHDVTILQDENVGGIVKAGVDLHASVLLIEKSDYSDDLANLRWLAIGSPVMLDGRNNRDEPYLGHCVTIMDVRDYEFDSGKYWAVELSGRFFDKNHPNWDHSNNKIEVDRGIWVFAADAYGAKSPALGSYVFTAVVR